MNMEDGRLVLYKLQRNKVESEQFVRACEARPDSVDRNFFSPDYDEWLERMVAVSDD